MNRPSVIGPAVAVVFFFVVLIALMVAGEQMGVSWWEFG